MNNKHSLYFGKACKQPTKEFDGQSKALSKKLMQPVYFEVTACDDCDSSKAHKDLDITIDWISKNLQKMNTKRPLQIDNRVIHDEPQSCTRHVWVYSLDPIAPKIKKAQKSSEPSSSPTQSK